MKNTKQPKDAILVMKSVNSDGSKWLKLFTGKTGDLFFSFYDKRVDANENYYRLFYTRAKLVTGSNILQLQFDDRGQIWVTCNRGENISDLKAGPQIGEGLLWHVDPSLQDKTKFVYPTSNDPIVTVFLDEHRSKRRGLTETSDQNSPVYNSYYNNSAVNNMPKPGDLYLIQNKASGEYLMKDMKGKLTQDNYSSNMNKSFVWQINSLQFDICNLKNYSDPNMLLKADQNGNGGQILFSNTQSGIDLSQQWSLIPDNSGNYFTVRNRGGANNQVMASENKNGHSLVVHTTEVDVDNQKWKFIPWDGKKYVPVGSVSIVSNPPYCLSGWSFDPDMPGISLSNIVIADGITTTSVANIKGTGMNYEINAANKITGYHQFNYKIPEKYYDGLTHKFDIYAKDATDSVSLTLIGSKSFTYNPCSVSPTPASTISSNSLIGFTSLNYNYSDSTLYAISSSTKIAYRWVDNKGWTGINEIYKFKSFAFDKNATIWAVSATTNQQAENEIIYFTPSNASWQKTGVNALKIACSPGGKVLGFIGIEGKIYSYNPVNNMKTLLGGDSAKEIAIDAKGTIWYIDTLNNIYYYDRVTLSWHKLNNKSALGTKISCGLDGSVFWISTNATVQKWDGYEGGYTVSNYGASKNQIAVLDCDHVAFISAGKLYLQSCNAKLPGLTGGNDVLTAKEKPEVNAAADSDQVTIYPNPASNEINISYLPYADNIVRFTIQDISGRTLMSKQVAAKNGQKLICRFSNLKLKGVSKGIYLVKINTKEDNIVKKLIVE